MFCVRFRYSVVTVGSGDDRWKECLNEDFYYMEEQQGRQEETTSNL
jgi:hypothetical protein